MSEQRGSPLRKRGRLAQRLHGIRITRVVNGAEHAKYFGRGSLPTKRPHAFGIDLHVDDSAGVALEGERYGFGVCVVERSASDWVERVLAAVDGADRTLRAAP